MKMPFRRPTGPTRPLLQYHGTLPLIESRATGDRVLGAIEVAEHCGSLCVMIREGWSMPPVGSIHVESGEIALPPFVSRGRMVPWMWLLDYLKQHNPVAAALYEWVHDNMIVADTQTVDFSAWLEDRITHAAADLQRHEPGYTFVLPDLLYALPPEVPTEGSDGLYEDVWGVRHTSVFRQGGRWWADIDFLQRAERPFGGGRRVGADVLAMLNGIPAADKRCVWIAEHETEEGEPEIACTGTEVELEDLSLASHPRWCVAVERLASLTRRWHVIPPQPRAVLVEWAGRIAAEVAQLDGDDSESAPEPEEGYRMEGRHARDYAHCVAELAYYRRLQSALAAESDRT